MIDTLYRLARPLIFRLDPERAHRLAIRALATGLAGSGRASDDAILRSTLWGREIANPIGLAAGFDKHAEAIGGCLALGFGFVEIGTVTPRPQPGNAKPRLFRLTEDEAVINRAGFNSEGLDAYRRRFAKRPTGQGLVGANVGKNKDTADEVSDFVAGIEATAALADYLVINVSSPNTPGLRDLQSRLSMERLIRACQEARQRAVSDGTSLPPLLVKIAPDLDEAGLADAAEVALATGLDGLIMGNTTISRPASLINSHRTETGGLSGKPLRDLAAERLATLYRLTGGRIPLIGAGGIASGADAYARIRAGASVVQLYSALVYEGPGLPARIKRDLAALLRRDGFGALSDAIGADHR
ncbi:quinone-dependent dihydroorotate dehydrogenase [Enterovirga rhinocerotis]|uniref:Dihydroorotate dehydrogenase (quinone) n=1 Tax=Enterovirga rhinocerotis TaxID=1339210 RepID=A0A4R7C6E0_9HYPH|nr:quinone-dependent dihydroorotate dehydrogenase [Enterovirga rhinocerotis]TDR94144.1 dihydroorotate oxidase A [Enterovirga rhinocerotis]